MQVSDLGITRYPSYRTSRHLCAFPSRQALLDYELALHQGAALDTALEVRARTTPLLSVYWSLLLPDALYRVTQPSLGPTHGKWP